MSRIDDMVAERIAKQTEPLLIMGQEQANKLVGVFRSWLGKQETFFEEYQSSYVKEILVKAREENVQLSLTEVIQKLAETDDRYLLSYKMISKELLSDSHGIRKVAYLIS